MNNQSTILVRRLGTQPYLPVWARMRAFTENRNSETIDELWVLQHEPVYTMGMNAKPEHLLNPGNIPVVHVDRGGEVTYHGPGQILIYLLMDWRRRNLGIKDLVSRIEQSIIKLLNTYNLQAYSRDDARGVYVDNRKIAALGLRARRKGCYHGLSFNIDMDLTPYQGINPCGYQGLESTQLTDCIGSTDFEDVCNKLIECVLSEFGKASKYE